MDLLPNSQQLLAALRWGMTLAGSYMLEHGITQGQWDSFSNGIYAAITIAPIVWSLFRHKETTQAAVTDKIAGVTVVGTPDSAKK